MANLLFVLTHSTEAPGRAAGGVRAAHAAQGAGHDVHLWLTGEGVRLGVRAVAETIREPGEPSVAGMLEALAAGGATFHLDRSLDRVLAPDVRGSEEGARRLATYGGR